MVRYDRKSVVELGSPELHANCACWTWAQHIANSSDHIANQRNTCVTGAQMVRLDDMVKKKNISVWDKQSGTKTPNSPLLPI